MLVYFVQWRMLERLGPILFAEEEAEAGRAARKSVVGPAVPSPARRKTTPTRRVTDSTLAFSFRALKDYLEERTAVGKRESRIELFVRPAPMHD